jgi:hypothetical protein
MLKSSGSRYSMSRTCGPQDMISLVIPRLGDNNDYTRMTTMYFLKKKSKAFRNFKIFKELVENEMDSRIKFLISDNGGEFISKEFMKFCEENGVKGQF